MNERAAKKRLTPFSLQNTLLACFVFFVLAAVICIGAGVNRFTEKLFASYARENIQARNREIAEVMAEQYDPLNAAFDEAALETMGMYFVHQGYIVQVRGVNGNVIWDARACDMEQCASVITEIQTRMENEHRLSGAFRRDHYFLNNVKNGLGELIGEISIETYGPFFYSKDESEFLKTLNSFLVAAGLVFIVLGVVISALLASGLSRPILRAAEASRRISGGEFSVRIPGRHFTRELGELSRSVNGLAAALENGERWQKRLTADIAHELRTPLTCLQGNIEAMIDGVREPDAERLASCHEEVRRLHKLVDDLNELSVIERENLSLHKTDFDLAKLLEAAAERFTLAAAEKGIAIRVEVSALPVNADYDRLMQVFVNLLSNAVKYTEAAKAAVITIRGTRLKGRCEVTVSDTGSGIAPEALPHIFERFYRADTSRGRGTGGAGIGLSIAAAIAAAHGGTITAASEEGKGSVFTVSFDG
ncbi:MAG: HAMP domain-containing protein [Treponema sp.]|jgi:signal transduction histidine kinase|nr:HAMP domain-containing protein [Treponema sp.]